MKIFDKFKEGFTRTEIKQYDANTLILDELKKCPALMQYLYERREQALKRMLQTKDPTDKIIEEGRLKELNDLLETESLVKQGLAMFKTISDEHDLDIDGQLNELRLQEEY